MNHLNLSLLFAVSLLLFNCDTTKKMHGLWLIEKVKVGDQEMTPQARWTRLNSDQSTESGNGWNQHTIGNWAYNKTTQEITLLNSNGVQDEYGAFSIDAQASQSMKWSRTEEGEKIEIFLKKIQKLPTAPFNTLLGVWKPIGEENPNLSHLFLRWDHIIVKQSNNQERQFGIYKTHGHKPELQIAYYGDPLTLETWTYELVSANQLNLKRTNDQGERIVQKFERIQVMN